MSLLDKKRVGVLRGGPSAEYEISLKTGSTILANLPQEYEGVDIFISQDGIWHDSGIEKDPHKILKSVDVVWNALHGSYGEDGKAQKLLEDFGIPFTGPNSISAAVSMNKVLSKNIFKKAGFKTPHHIILHNEGGNEAILKMVKEINENMLFPIIMKPVNSGSSIGVSIATNSSMVKDALLNSFKYSPNLLVEEFIDGIEATCGVIEGFRGQSMYTLLPATIVKNKDRKFHDYESKYVDLDSRYELPGTLSDKERSEIQKATSTIHNILGLRHYSRSDFILHPRRGLYVLEVNSLPDISHRSSFTQSLEALGSNIKEFLSHILHKTLHKR